MPMKRGRPSKTDRARVDATTEAEIAAQIAADPDTAPDIADALTAGAGRVVPAEIDVAGLRRRLDLTQQGFADRLGVGKSLVADWEQHRKRPSGPARTLLAIVDRLGWQALNAIR